MRVLITKLILFQFTNELNLLYPVYILFFQRHGLDAFLISILLSIWAGVKLLLEIPSGIIADKYSRRNLLLIGRITRIAAFSIWMCAGSGFLFEPFWYFAIGFALWGISASLFSGTFLAFVYDELKAYGRESDYEKVQGWMITASVSGIAIALFVGGFVAEISYLYVFIASIISTSIAFAIMLSIQPVQIVQSTDEKNYLTFLFVVFQNARRNALLAKLIFLLVPITALYGTIEEFYPFIFRDLGFSEGMVGFAYGVNFLFVILGSVLVGHISKYARNWEVLLSLTAGFFILLLALGKTPIYLLGIYIAAMLLTIFEIRLINKIQLQIASHERATVLSINSFLTGGLGLVLFLWYGHMTNTSGVFRAVFFTGSSIVVVSLIGIFFLGSFHSGVRLRIPINKETD